MSKRSLLIGIVALAGSSVCLLAQGPAVVSGSPETRIVHTDPAKYRHLTAVHDGAGTMDFNALLGTNALDSDLIFLHRGVIQPHSGIGAHFHNRCEEMFVILDGEAQFTIDGRTSLIKGPAGAPALMGHSHGLYNATDKPVQWLNINVGLTKKYDAFNLGDDRVGAPLDPHPTFISLRLDRSLLKPLAQGRHGKGAIQSRRLLEPSVFTTSWAYVDHLLLPSGSALMPNSQADMSEVYYVLAGAGTVASTGTASTAAAPIRTGDAIPVRLGEGVVFTGTGTEPLEFMVIGVSRSLATKEALLAQSAGTP